MNQTSINIILAIYAYLGDEAIQIGVGGPLNVEKTSANVVNGLVVKHDGHIRVLEQGMRGQHTIVGLHHRIGDLRTREDGHAQLRLRAIVHRKTLEQERAQAGARAASDRVEY